MFKNKDNFINKNEIKNSNISNSSSSFNSCSKDLYKETTKMIKKIENITSKKIIQQIQKPIPYLNYPEIYKNKDSIYKKITTKNLNTKLNGVTSMISKPKFLIKDVFSRTLHTKRQKKHDYLAISHSLFIEKKKKSNLNEGSFLNYSIEKNKYNKFHQAKKNDATRIIIEQNNKSIKKDFDDIIHNKNGGVSIQNLQNLLKDEVQFCVNMSLLTSKNNKDLSLNTSDNKFLVNKISYFK